MRSALLVILYALEKPLLPHRNQEGTGSTPGDPRFVRTRRLLILGHDSGNKQQSGRLPRKSFPNQYLALPTGEFECFPSSSFFLHHPFSKIWSLCVHRPRRSDSKPAEMLFKQRSLRCLRYHPHRRYIEMKKERRSAKAIRRAINHIRCDTHYHAHQPVLDCLNE